MKKIIYLTALLVFCVQVLTLNCSAQFWDTFESYSTQAAADAAWNPQGAIGDDICIVDITADRIELEVSSGNLEMRRQTVYYDLGVGNVSDNNWVLRAVFTFYGTLTRLTNSMFYFGLTDQLMSPTIGFQVTTDACRFNWYFGTQFGTTGNGIYPGALDNTIGHHYTNYQQSSSASKIGGASNFIPSSGTSYYIEMVRSGGTTLTLNYYGTSDFTTVVESATIINGSPNMRSNNTGSSSAMNLVNNLRYISFGLYNDHQMGTFNVAVDDVQFCNGVTTFNCNPTPLPIDLLSFSARWQDETYDAAIIEWQTANEINNDYFEIERSTDAINFSPIMQVGGLNNIAITDYLKLDTDPYKEGASYYRLKQVDNDGTFSYSQIEVLNIPEGLEIINLYPNPVKDWLNFSLLSSLDTEVEIQITNALGQKVLSQTKLITQGLTSVEIDLPNLGDGNYFLNVETGSEGYKTQRKFISNQQN